MNYESERLRRIFEKTDGRCHICHTTLTFSAYGDCDHPGGWEVDHSNPRANGGGDHMNNYLPAHASCNRSKGALSTRAARARHGLSRAPMSAARQAEARVSNALGGAALGASGGAAFAHWLNQGRPPVQYVSPRVLAFLGGALGALVGYSANPE